MKLSVRTQTRLLKNLVHGSRFDIFFESIYLSAVVLFNIAYCEHYILLIDVVGPEDLQASVRLPFSVLRMRKVIIGKFLDDSWVCHLQ